MQLTFLGTSSMVPTKARNHNSMFLTYKEHGILIDCGEGTQRQLKIAGIKPSKITMILLTHWHGDHVLGLPGLIQTLGTSEYNGKLRIYGPAGSRMHFEYLKKAFVFEERMELEVNEVKDGIFFENDDIEISAAQMEHTTPCVAYSIKEKDRRKFDSHKLDKHGVGTGPHFKELEAGKSIDWKGKSLHPDEVSQIKKGRKITVIMDTRFNNEAVEFAKDSDILVCESTFVGDMQEKARKYKHMTSLDAGRLAVESNSKRLVLTHFSQRYKEAETAKKEAQTLFKNVTCAEDFMIMNINKE